MPSGVGVFIAVGVAIVAIWGIFVVTIAVLRPKNVPIREAVSLLPDLLRLISRLARDRSMPRGVRIRLWALLAYLASPIDIIPDFIPVVGYVDDAVVIALVLRSTIRAAGVESVRAHWSGTEGGFAMLQKLTGTR